MLEHSGAGRAVEMFRDSDGAGFPDEPDQGGAPLAPRLRAQVKTVQLKHVEGVQDGLPCPPGAISI